MIRRSLPAALALSTTWVSNAQVLPPAIPAQQNVQSYHIAPQQNVAPSSDIPTPESYQKQQQTATGQDTQHKKMADLLTKKDYADFQIEFEKKPEGGWAESLAWIYYKDGKRELAKTWFSRALSLDVSDESASYGLALIAKDEGHVSAATTLALQSPHQPTMRLLLQQIYAADAGQSYNHKQYARTLDYLEKAKSFGPLTFDQRKLRAWTHYQLQQYVEAEREFEALYRERHDSSSAQGLFYSLQRLDQWEKSRDLASSLGGPLVLLVRDEQARHYYDRELFLAVAAESPNLYPALKNIDSPSLDLGAALRQKSGTSGLSSLEEDRLPFAGGTFVFDKVNQLTVQASHMYLDSGPLAAHAQVGTPPVVPHAYSFTPTTRLDLTMIDVGFSHQGWFTPYIELGTTPIGASVSVLPTGRLGFVQQEDSGNWGVSIFNQSNTESILSYAGIRDPYTGRNFGRVVESGVTATGYQDLGDNWGFTGEGTLGVLTGEQVKTNEHAALSLGVGKDLRLDGFQYFVLGPGLFAEHFERNLSGFTVGQGGYFSPDYLGQGTLDLNFLTLEGQPYIVRARFGVGGQANRQGGSDVLPLSPDGRTNQATTQGSYVIAAEVEGAVRLGDHWQFGGSLSYDQTATYSEAREMLFFRYLFESRPAVFSSDLMKWP